MDQEAKPNVLQKFLKLDFRDKVLWILALGMAGILAVSMIYESFIQPVGGSVPSDTTGIHAPDGYMPRTITMDPEGNAWVWTFGNELLIYDGETWDALDEIYELTSGELYVLEIAFDTHGQVWIGTTRHGLFIYDGESLEQVDLSQTGEYVHTIAFDPADRAWIGSFFDVSVYDGESWQTYTSDNSDLSGRIADIAFDSRGQAWIGTSNGLFRFDGDNWEIYTPENSGLLSKFVTAVAVDSQDQIWVGTEDGLNLFDGQVWENYLIQSADLNANYIQDIFFDTDSKIWVFSLEYRPIEVGVSSGTVSVLDGSNWFLFDRINLHRIFSANMDSEGRIWFLLDNRSIIISSSDLSAPLYQSAAQRYVEPDVRYPYLRLGNLIEPLIGLAFLWVMIFITRLKSNFGLVSLLIPLLSFPVFSSAGFNVDAEALYIPFANILLLFFGLSLAFKGNRAGESRGLTALAVVLNVVMLLLYFVQFLFVATFG